MKGIKNIMFGADALFLAKLTGPGTVFLQTMPIANLAAAIAPYLGNGDSSTSGGGTKFSIGGLSFGTDAARGTAFVSDLTTSDHGVRPLGAEVRLDCCDLRVQRVGVARSMVDLDHHAHARRVLRDAHHARFDEVHHLVPLALDVGEHRVGLVGQAAVADELHRSGDGPAHRIAGTERTDGERSNHAPIVALNRVPQPFRD